MSDSRESIQKIAAAQKLLLWAILASIATNLGAMGLRVSLQTNPIEPEVAMAASIGLLGLQIAIVILQLVAVIKLCMALNEGWATAVYAILQCVPCLNLILLLFLNGRATNRLKEAGIRVGLMGANSSDVANYQPQRRKCDSCGEPVAQDAVTCPMCGQTL